MTGLWNDWATSLMLELVGLAKQKRMRLGYIEFSHTLEQYMKDGMFFVRDYEALVKTIRRAQCNGVTDYQLPISAALRAFSQLGAGREGRHNQHIIFLTDGLPTTGDRHLTRELELAQNLGVCIHTVFIGYQTFPRILQR